MNQFLPGLLRISLGPIQNCFTKIHGDIRTFVFITGVNDTGDRLFTGVTNNDTKLLPVSLLPGINYLHQLDYTGN
jgi:hypothetical protein